MSALIFEHAHINVSPSHYLKQSFAAYGYPNVTYIPNTIELKHYPFGTKDFHSIKLLWVRSFSKIYNPSLAIAVLKRLMDKGYAAELCMVGPDADGSLKTVKAYAKSLGVDVLFTGKLTKREWIGIAKDYNIFINTTNFDNTPISVIEAMALGLPVVSTNVGGMPYLIDHGKDGLLVEPDHVEQMVAAILELHDTDVLADTIASNARLKVEQFDWEVVKYRWFEILQ